MNNLYCYNVNESEYGLTFDEGFNMSHFYIHFDTENDHFGRVEFEPVKRFATMAYYGHPEDLTPSIYHYDLLNSPKGHALMAAFNTYNLGEVYRSAKAFTEWAIKDLLDERERLWREYMEGV